MERKKYNENAAALNWEIVNGSSDIGKWNLWYLGKLIQGTGFEEFFNAAKTLSSDINVVFVKRIKWFIHIAKNFINFKDKAFFANLDKDFYYIELDDNIELRDWEQFWKKIDDGEEFLKRLDLCRTYLNHGEHGELKKNKASLKDHYKFTLAKEMWKDEINMYYLYNDTKTYCESLLPQDEDELYWMGQFDKAGFYFQNQDYINKIVPNVHCYDISSAFLSFLLREKFPMEGFKRAETLEEVRDVTSNDFHCWYGVFRFHKLQYKVDFPLDLQRFGQPAEDEICCWDLLLTNVDMEWVKKVFKWDYVETVPSLFYYTRQKELAITNYRKMFIDLYQAKDCQKKGTFAKEIAKFRAELPFGQPIKSFDYSGKVVFNEKENDFVIVENEEKTFDQIRVDLMKRKIPMYVGLWVAAYARKEFIDVVSKIGFDKVVYGDTDSVKFIGEEGIEVIKEHNKETLKKIKKLDKKYALTTNEKLGQWLDEGTVDKFKAITCKWYLTQSNGEIEVKAAGANPEKIKAFLLTKKNPFNWFAMWMEAKEMRYTIYSKDNTVNFEFMDKIDSDFKQQICKKSRNTTTLYYFNPYEEESK